MKILLLYDVEKLGRQGESHDVSKGYARNYLLPNGLAVIPTKGASRQLDLAKRRVSKQEVKFVEESKKLRLQIESLKSIDVVIRANQDGKLYGSITPTAVKELLKENGVIIEAKNIKLPQPIKVIGEYDIDIELFKESTKIHLVVKPEQEPEPEQISPTEGDASKE
ncbi:MAG: 50S ribosomal protein L9 [Planctomycetes bacterium]|nr:50S ribosomal protein L9 [Planctomycetota bacterium]